MTTEEAIKVVEQFQRWRLGKTDKMLYTPRALTEALEVVVKTAKRSLKKECDHPYMFLTGEEHGNPKCNKCGKLLC